MDTKIIAGFFTLGEEHFDYLEDTLNAYDIGQYLIGFEITPDAKKKEHFHVLFEGTDQIWNAFSKKVVEDHKLRGEGKGNKKYGKVKKDIRDFDAMCSYTLKEGNYRGNFPQEDVERWYKESFSKNEKVEIREKILKGLKDFPYQTINALRLRAIQLSSDIGQNHRPTRSGIDGLVLEHYSRTGQNTKVFSLLYPMEEPPSNYSAFRQSVVEQVNHLGDIDNLEKETLIIL
jgi:hypothetical protein